VPSSVLLVSRRPEVLRPLRAACVAAGLEAVTVDDPLVAPRVLATVSSDRIAGVILDLATTADHELVAPLCEELRALPGMHEPPILLLGAGGDITSIADAVAVGGDGYFALPVDAARIVAKLLTYTGGSLPPLPPLPVPAHASDDRPHRGPAAMAPMVADAATPDELLAALDGVTALPATAEPVDDDRDFGGERRNDSPPRVDAGDRAADVERAGRLLGAGQGPCGPGTPAGLLWAACTARTTGMLEVLEEDGARRGISLVDGVPTRVRSTVAAEQPEALLLRLGVVTRARLASLRARGPLPQRLGPLCALLVDVDALLPEERAGAIRAVLAAQLTAFVGSRGGAWQLRDGADDAVDPSVERVDADGLPALVVEGLRRRFDEDRLFDALGGPGSVLAPTGAGLPLVVEEALTPDERRGLTGFNGARSLDEVVRRIGLPPSLVWRAGLVGLAFDVVRLTHRAPAPTTAARLDRRTHARTLERERVSARLELARAGDPFGLLSLSADATPHEIAVAAAALRARHDPGTALRRGLGELRPALLELVEAINEAEAELLDDEVRRRVGAGGARDHDDDPVG
jgi:CheY-like chemotaxis protein